jgi:hypothetical protein
MRNSSGAALALRESGPLKKFDQRESMAGDRTKSRRKPQQTKKQNRPITKSTVSQKRRSSASVKSLSKRKPTAGEHSAGVKPAAQEDRPVEKEAAIRVLANPNYQKIQKAIRRRWRSLLNSKEFILETFALRQRLGDALQNDPDEIRKFFCPHFFVDVMYFPTVEKKINRVRDNRLRELLMRYAKYGLRYGVGFELDENKSQFRARMGDVWGNKFNVAIRNGRLEPAGGAPFPEEGLPVSDGFESDGLPVPANLKQLVEEGTAKYVVINDEDDFSVIRQLLEFAYSPNQITVVEYGSTFRHQFYLIGENVPLNQAWPQLQKVAAKFQRSVVGHNQQGSPGDLRRLYEQLIALVRRKESMGVKAAWLIQNEERRARLRLHTNWSRARELERMKKAEAEKARAEKGKATAAQGGEPAAKQAKPRTYSQRLATKQSLLSQLKRKLQP